MSKEEIFEVFYGKEKWDVYRNFQIIENDIEKNDNLYQYFDEIVEMLLNEKSYIRIRGFRVISKLARYDKLNKINDILDLLFKVLDDDLPTAVRQCLKAINDIIIYKPELSMTIKDRLKKINYLKYNESMQPLIKKDIENLVK